MAVRRGPDQLRVRDGEDECAQELLGVVDPRQARRVLAILHGRSGDGAGHDSMHGAQRWLGRDRDALVPMTPTTSASVTSGAYWYWRYNGCGSSCRTSSSVSIGSPLLVSL